MNTRGDVGMGRYIEALKAHHAENQEDERAYHNYMLDSFGLAGAAKSHIVQERNAAAVAHLIRNSDVRAAISKLDDRSQVEALKKIRSGESSGPEPERDDNADSYLRSREEAIRSGERNVSGREKRALSRR